MKFPEVTLGVKNEKDLPRIRPQKNPLGGSGFDGHGRYQWSTGICGKSNKQRV